MCTLSICQSLQTRDRRRWQERGLIHKQMHASKPAVKTWTHAHFITDKNYIGDKILDVSSPEANFASMVNLLISSYSDVEHRNTTKCSLQLCIKSQVRFLPAAPSTPIPSSTIHILTLTFMEPLDRGEAEYIEPEKRCRRGGEGADKAWWKKVEWSEWSGWVGGGTEGCPALC